METLSREEVAARIQLIEDPTERALATKYALEVYGPAPQTERFAPFRFDPHKYIPHFLGWQPWRGEGPHKPGQWEVIEAYRLALIQQFEKRDYEAGRLTEDQLEYWKPGQVIQNYIRMEAGHNTGKTKVASGLISHFFDCFAPSATTMYAPTGDALRDNLWEELRTDRLSTSLPGRILGNIEIRFGPNHYIKGRAVSNSHGRGTERVQGKHGEFLLFVIDEAEGVDDFVFDAIDSMTSGGICVVLMMANPKTRTSKFHKIKDRANVVSFRMSCVNHPNVVAGRELVPNAVQREYVRSMVEGHCEVVKEHNVDLETFTLDWDVVTRDSVWPAGTVFQPDHECCWRVLGVAPGDITDKTVISVGRYNAAKNRETVMPLPEDHDRATLGIDVARFGKDYGTLYIRLRDEVWREKQFFQQDSKEYFHAVKDAIMKLVARGVTRVQVRIDAGGGEGLIDTLNHSMELREALVFFQVIAVHFGGSAKKFDKYDDLATEMYFEARETLLGVRLLHPPEALESDLTKREWEPVNRHGRELKKLQDKKAFRKEIKRSPDDGDGFVLCVAPDHLFGSGSIVAPRAVKKSNPWA